MSFSNPADNLFPLPEIQGAAVVSSDKRSPTSRSNAPSATEPDTTRDSAARAQVAAGRVDNSPMFLSTDQVRVLARLILGDVSDKAGLLASAHAERVAARVLPHQVQVALLHDVLEDSTATWQDLVYLNVDPRVVTDVVMLTHVRSAESYMDYVRRIANSDSARAIAVKIADIDDHLRPMQGFLLPASMVARYTLARDILSGVIA